MRVCRFCKDYDGGRMLKYGTRHYAHYGCWLHYRGAEWKCGEVEERLSELYEHQLRDFPVFGLQDWLKARGFKKHAMNVIEKALKLKGCKL
jgi:hypothetical protein